jgi:phage terminase large subunit-like protein
MPTSLLESRPWLPEPPAGTQVALGFDGSDSDDFTALRARTRSGLAFTPRHGDDDRPTIWNPAESGGRIPRLEVDAAVDRAFDRFKVSRLYYDPPGWTSEGEAWALRHGEERVIRWETYRTRQMHEALARYFTDLTNRKFTHDGCPITAQHAVNARKAPRGERYILAKPAQHQKIDAVMADVLSHEAFCDMWATGWVIDEGPTYFRLPR